MIVSSHLKCRRVVALTLLSLTIASITYTAAAPTAMIAAPSPPVSDLCPLFPRQQTDKWELTV